MIFMVIELEENGIIMYYFLCWWPAKQNDFLAGYQWDTIQVCRDLIRDKTMNIKDLQEKRDSTQKPARKTCSVDQ